MKNKEEKDLEAQVRKDYFKQWRANNKDKIKEYNSNYWKKRAQRIKNDSQSTK